MLIARLRRQNGVIMRIRLDDTDSKLYPSPDMWIAVYSLGPLGHVPSARWPRPHNADGSSAVPTKKSNAADTIKPRRATKITRTRTTKEIMDGDGEGNWPELTEGGVLKGSSLSWQRSYRSFDRQLPLWQRDEPKKQRGQREEVLQSQMQEVDSETQKGKKRVPSKNSLASGDVVSQTPKGLPHTTGQHARERELELRRKCPKRPLFLLQKLLRMGGTTVTSTPLDEIWVLVRYMPQLREPEKADGRSNVRKLDNEHQESLTDKSAIRAPVTMEPVGPAEVEPDVAPAPSPQPVAATASLPVGAPAAAAAAAAPTAASPPKNPMAVWRYVDAEHVPVPGKVTPDDLMGLLSAGTIKLSTMVWKPKMAGWTELRYVPELREALRNRPRSEKELWHEAETKLQAIRRGKVARLNASKGNGNAYQAVIDALSARGESSNPFSAREHTRAGRLSRTEESVRRTHALRHSRTEESARQAHTKLTRLPSCRDVDVPTASPRVDRPPSARGGLASERGGLPSERGRLPSARALPTPRVLASRHSRNAISSFFDFGPSCERQHQQLVVGSPAAALISHEEEHQEQDSPSVANGGELPACPSSPRPCDPLRSHTLQALTWRPF